MAIKLLITDFDGTLVDTFEANYGAYREAFEGLGLTLTPERYRDCFGLRFDNFMSAMGISDDDVKKAIRGRKGDCYPDYFNRLKVNTPLLEIIRAFRRSGGKTAVASTAREHNLLNALRHIGAENDFDLILAGESVSHGKPDPEIYLKVLKYFGVEPSDALVFEDSEVGFKAAEAAGTRYIIINKEFYGN